MDQATIISPSLRQEIDALHLRIDKYLQADFKNKNFLDQLGEEVPLNGEKEKLLVEQQERHPLFHDFPRLKELLSSWGVRRGLSYYASHLVSDPDVWVQCVLERQVDEESWWMMSGKFISAGFICGKAFTFGEHSLEIDSRKREGLDPEMLALLKVFPIIMTDDPTVPSFWLPPPNRSLVWNADPMIAPLEAHVLIRDAANRYFDDQQDTAKTTSPKILCIGLGDFLGAYALSVMLPNFWVFHIPTPLYDPRLFEDLLKSYSWDMLVINIPNCSQWRATEVGGLSKHRSDLSDTLVTYLQRRDWITDQSKPTAHVSKIIDLAIHYKRKGGLVAIMADPEVYQAAVRRLTSKKQIEPVPSLSAGANQPYVVEYPPDGCHRGLPSLPAQTGRHVSFWRWR